MTHTKARQKEAEASREAHDKTQGLAPPPPPPPRQCRARARKGGMKTRTKILPLAQQPDAKQRHMSQLASCLPRARTTMHSLVLACRQALGAPATFGTRLNASKHQPSKVDRPGLDPVHPGRRPLSC